MQWNHRKLIQVPEDYAILDACGEHFTAKLMEEAREVARRANGRVLVKNVNGYEDFLFETSDRAKEGADA